MKYLVANIHFETKTTNHKFLKEEICINCMKHLVTDIYFETNTTNNKVIKGEICIYKKINQSTYK